ncbi:transposase [Deinococcus malanensis]|uniref:Transposase n=1 Tax=Deinococcus malanensis TaxID=1706855 RepID=A0ABQ2F5F2_9DEIO|nr:transposase [Deinococcus malanensis]GGK42642.1 transposase [Deinococcus malanensis]
MSKAREVYSPEFKQEAVKLVKTTGKSCAEVARDLGIPAHYVVRWRQQQEKQDQAGRPAFTGRGNAALSAQEARLKALERELEVTRQERDILKKALAFFAKQP